MQLYKEFLRELRESSGDRCPKLSKTRRANLTAHICALEGYGERPHSAPRSRIQSGAAGPLNGKLLKLKSAIRCAVQESMERCLLQRSHHLYKTPHMPPRLPSCCSQRAVRGHLRQEVGAKARAQMRAALQMQLGRIPKGSSALKHQTAKLTCY